MWIFLFEVIDWLLDLPATIYFCIISCLALLFFSVRINHSQKHARESPGDWALVGYVCLQVVGVFTGVVPANTAHFVVASISSLCCYRIFRTIPFTERLLVAVLRTFTVLGFCDAISNLALEYQSLQSLRIFPHDSLESLHALIRFVGGPTRNDALLVLLLLQGFAVADWVVEEHLKSQWVWAARLSVAMLTAALMTSLSRGIYIASFIFVVLLILLWRAIKSTFPAKVKTGILMTCAVCALAVLAFNLAAPIYRSVLIFHSVSQQRSAAGRFALWGARLHLIKIHPVFGWGWLSDGVVSLASIQQTSEVAFTARAYNMPLELLVSGGFLGFLVYSVFLIDTLQLLRPSRIQGISSPTYRIASSMLGAVLVSAIVRDLTYSSLVLHGTCVFLSFLICALILSAAHYDDSCGLSRPSGKLQRIILNLTAIVLGAVVVCFYFSLSASESKYLLGTKSLQHDEPKEALDYFASAADGPWKSAAFYSAEGFANLRLALPDRELPKSMEFTIAQGRQVYLIDAKAAYDKAISKSPYDAYLWTSVGWVDTLLGNNDTAKSEFQKAIGVDPYDFFAHLSMGMMYEKALQFEPAANEYKDALMLSPRLVQSSFWNSLKKQHPSMADEVLRRSIDKLHSQLPSPIAEARLAALDEARGDPARSLAEYADAAKALPNLSYPWLGLAKADIAGKDKESALLGVRRSLVADPGNILAKLELAHLLYERGETIPAASIYRQALYTAPHSPHAQRFERIYHIQPLAPDDIVPPGLLEWTEPVFPFEAICEDLVFLGIDSYANQSFVQRRYTTQLSECER